MEKIKFYKLINHRTCDTCNYIGRCILYFERRKKNYKYNNILKRNFLEI